MGADETKSQILSYPEGSIFTHPARQPAEICASTLVDRLNTVCVGDLPRTADFYE